MAQDPSDGISYYLLIRETHLSDLATIRQWSNLKIAHESGFIWVGNFSYVQIESVQVKSLPAKTIYYEKKGKLYLLNSLLPDRNEPSLLWTPIERALPLKIEKYNHNYFGITEKISIRLVEDEIEKKANVLLCTMKELLFYANSAPEFRLNNLYWVNINNREALIFGEPILPIQGKTYWKTSQMILPVGYNFELAILEDTISKLLNPEDEFWIVWNEDSSFFKVEKQMLRSLSLSSVRKTIAGFEQFNLP